MIGHVFPEQLIKPVAAFFVGDAGQEMRDRRNNP
jgi:hypothetical protein